MPIERRRRDRHRDVLADAEVAEREAHADELGDDREEVEDEQIAHREPSPEAAEALVDQARVTDTRHRAEADHHLLVDDQHRDQQQQHPQQAGAVVLARLRVRGDAAGVVVADHHDQARAHDRQQRHRARAPAVALAAVVHADRAESAADVADVRLVEDRRHALGGALRAGRERRLILGHLGLPPFLISGAWHVASRRTPARTGPGESG